MKDEKHFPFSKYPEYNGTKIWIPNGYQRSVTDKIYRRYSNTKKQYTKYTIQNVSPVKSDELGIVCDLISNDGKRKSCMPGVYLTHEQIGTFIRNEEKAMLSDFDKITYIEDED